VEGDQSFQNGLVYRTFFTLEWSSIQSIYYEVVKVPVKNLGKSGRQAQISE